MSAPRSDPRIVVKNLTMAYGQHIIMKEMNFEVRRGEILVVMGGSGCGKSTLMKHLVGLIEPASGEIFLVNGISRRLTKKNVTRFAGPSVCFIRRGPCGAR